MKWKQNLTNDCKNPFKPPRNKQDTTLRTVSTYRMLPVSRRHVHSSDPFMETLSRNCSISSLEKESLYGHWSLNNNHHCAMKNRSSNTNLIFFYNKVPRMACQRNILCYLSSYQQGFLVNPSRIWLTQLFGFFSKSRAYAW